LQCFSAAAAKVYKNIKKKKEKLIQIYNVIKAATTDGNKDGFITFRN
jgi:hypothetical protein